MSHSQMEVDEYEISEQFILNLTGHRKISQVKELDLSKQGLDHLDGNLLKKMPLLEALDISRNHLESFPSDVTLKNLRSLDLSQNEFSSLAFLSQFPNLQELKMDGNNIDVPQSEKHIIVELCPELIAIDNHKVDSLRNLNDRLKEKLQTQLEHIWEDDYNETYCNGIPGEDEASFTEEISAKIKKIDKKNTLTGARDFLLQKLVEDLVCDIQEGKYRRNKRRRLSPSVQSTHGATNGNTSMSVSNSPATPKGRPQRSPKKPTTTKLPDLNDYNPVTFLRCHFGDRAARKQGCGDNDPKDEFTKIWQCAFEPDPYDPEKDTGQVATCGGHTVNLIDCSTGKIMKKYKHQEEQFYSIAWTTLTLTTEAGERPTNILAVGGYDACIKLLHPDQFVCYKEWGSGKPNKTVSQGAYYISDLIFHPQNKTWLFAGASDTTITLWDIGIPSGSKHDTTVSKLTVFTCEAEILRMLISVNTGHLVASTSEEIVAWNLPKNDTQMQKMNKRHHNVELEVPCDQIEADGMVLVTDDLVASKCVGHDCIFVWSLADCLDKTRSKKAEIKPLFNLQWKETEQEFINIGAGNGIVACGDDVGTIWMYNLQSLLKKKKVSATGSKYSPSLVLEWPECDLDDKSNQDKQMTDILDKPDILLVNDIAISASGEYLVGVTDNNLVCIWKADSGEDDSSS